MRTVSLQEICDIQIGKTPSRSVPEYWGGELPWVTISDFAAGRIVTTTKERITRIGAVKSGSKRIPRGTLLLSFKLSLGKRAVSGCDLFTNEAIAALHVRDHDLADRDYLYWALGSIDYDRLVLVDRAAKGKTLNKAKLKILRIPLPPLSEQRRIAGILDAADALRAKRRAALAYLDTLTQSIFLDMLGDPATNPKGWPVAALRSLGRVTTGRTPPSAKEGMFDGAIPFVTPGDLESDQPIKRTVTDAGAEASRTVDAAATLVCCIGATIGKIGRSTVRSAFNQQINAVEWGERVHAEYGCAVMRFFKPTIVAWGSSTTLPILKKSSFERIEIPVPPVTDQQEFALRIERVERIRATHRVALSTSNELFSVLQVMAFQGCL